MAGDDVTITIRADSGAATRAFRDTEGRLRDMRGRFVSEGSVMSGAMRGLSASIGSLAPIATAAVPAAAALGVAALKTAGAAAGAGMAVAAFGAAVAGQMGSLSDAAKAQDKYNEAVVQYGVGSAQAGEAQHALSRSLSSMPQSTARAAVAMGTLKDTFRDWSDSVADFTMTPVEKSFTVLGQLVPKLTGMAKGASSQLDRLVTIAGGAIATPGFDALTEKLTVFANSALKEAVDGIIHFTRVLSEGQSSGPIQAFMEYAERNGPVLRETLHSVGAAVTTLVEASAAAGPGMLTLVNAAAKLVASFPPGLVTVLMQTAVALKAVSLAGAAAAAIGGRLATVRAEIAALGATSAAAGGGLAGLRAAFLSLGTAAKASVVAAGVVAIGLAVSKLSDIGRKAPADIDKMTASVRELGRSGKVSGEAARVFGADMEELAHSFDIATDNDFLEFMDELSSGFGLFEEGENSKAKEMISSFDDALANLVKSGNADIAKAALENFRKEAEKSGYDIGNINDRLGSYNAALADAKFEQELAIQSMGIFGAAAQATSAKLEAQKQSADGLRASILALNDVNRSAYDAQIDFEAAIDSLSESFKENGATLDLNTEAGRKNGEAMSAAAKSRDEMIASGLAAGESLASMTKKSDSLRESMLKLATDAFDGNKKKAQEYVDTLLGTPGEIATLVKLERDEAITGLQTVQDAIQATPDAKEVTVTTLNAAAIRALEAVGYKTEQLPDGRTRVYTANGQALSSIGAVSTAMNKLDGTSANTYVNTIYTKEYRTYRQMERDSINGNAHGGRVRGYASGGNIQAFPNGGYVQGPGSGTSDSILALMGSGAKARVSNTEYVVNAQSTRKYLPLLEAINRGSVPRAAGGTGGYVRGAGSGSRSVYQINMVVDGRVVAKAMFDPFREEIRTRGGYARALPV